MSKNNPMGKTVPEKRNYKLYKAKKQWVTACATFLVLFGTAAMFQEDVHADSTATASQTVVAGSNSSTLQSSSTADTSSAAQGGSAASITSGNDSQSTASAAPASQSGAASAQSAASAAPASAAGVTSAAKADQPASSTTDSSASASASSADASLELPVSAVAASTAARANSSLLTISLYSTDATTTITADNIPDGATNEDGSAVTKDDFTKTVTRTVTFDYVDKTPTTQVQKATLTRTGNYDATTKKVTWNDYSTGTFARLTSPTDGTYLPSMRTIQRAINVTADYVDPKIIVTYGSGIQRVGNVETIDDDNNGAVIANVFMQTYAGATIDINGLSSPAGKLLVPSGYELAAGQSATFTVTGDNFAGAKAVKVKLVRKTVNKTYTFVDDDDSDSVVGSTTVSGKWGKAIATGLTLPDGYEFR